MKFLRRSSIGCSGIVIEEFHNWVHSQDAFDLIIKCQYQFEYCAINCVIYVEDHIYCICNICNLYKESIFEKVQLEIDFWWNKRWNVCSCRRKTGMWYWLPPSARHLENWRLLQMTVTSLGKVMVTSNDQPSVCHFYWCHFY